MGEQAQLYFEKETCFQADSKMIYRENIIIIFKWLVLSTHIDDLDRYYYFILFYGCKPLELSGVNFLDFEHHFFLCPSWPYGPRPWYLSDQVAEQSQGGSLLIRKE